LSFEQGKDELSGREASVDCAGDPTLGGLSWASSFINSAIGGRYEGHENASTHS
jgi:hypothetical protein